MVELGVKCLEGTTERSDGNRGRSPRIDDVRTMCLEFSCKREQSSLLELPSAAENLKEEALRHRTCSLNIYTGVLPSRQNFHDSIHRALRARLSSLRSVLPSRQLIPYHYYYLMQPTGYYCSRNICKSMNNCTINRQKCAFFTSKPYEIAE